MFLEFHLRFSVGFFQKGETRIGGREGNVYFKTYYENNVFHIIFFKKYYEKYYENISNELGLFFQNSMF